MEIAVRYLVEKQNRRSHRQSEFEDKYRRMIEDDTKKLIEKIDDHVNRWSFASRLSHSETEWAE